MYPMTLEMRAYGSARFGFTGKMYPSATPTAKSRMIPTSSALAHCRTRDARTWSRVTTPQLCLYAWELRQGPASRGTVYHATLPMILTLMNARNISLRLESRASAPPCCCTWPANPSSSSSSIGPERLCRCWSSLTCAQYIDLRHNKTVNNEEQSTDLNYCSRVEIFAELHGTIRGMLHTMGDNQAPSQVDPTCRPEQFGGLRHMPIGRLGHRRVLAGAVQRLQEQDLLNATPS